MVSIPGFLFAFALRFVHAEGPGEDNSQVEAFAPFGSW